MHNKVKPLPVEREERLPRMERVHGVAQNEEIDEKAVTDPSKMPEKPAKKAKEEADKQQELDEAEPDPKPAADDEEKPAKTAKDGDDDGDADEDDSEYGKKVQKRIARETYKRREAERKAAEMAAELERLRQERQQHTGQLSSSQEMALNAHEERLKAERERLKRDYRDAVERGDSEKLFDIEEQIADVRVELKRLGFLRDEMKARRPAQAEAAAEDTGQATAPASRQVQPSQKAVDWAAQNKAWFGPHRAMTAAAYGIDADLKEEGYDPNSDDFYSELTRRVRELFPGQFPRRSTASAVAGVDRQPQSRGSGKPRPTEGQRDMARRLGVPIEEYMKYVPKD
jgi:hypothetical protein